MKASPYPSYRPSGAPWLGDVPEHWGVRQLGSIGSFFKGSGGTKEDEVEDGVPCVRYGDLYTQHQFFIRETRANITEESARRYTQIQYGDILFAGSGETLEEIGKSAVNLIEDPAYCGGDIIVFRPLVKADAAFLGYAADCSTSIYQKACMGRGVTVMHIYTQALSHLLLPLPPLDEQRAIAAFLDRETERIDALVAKKRQLIERLQEYRTALITRTVTRGLPPDAAHAAGLDPSPRLKPSGVEWLGDVPEHWEVIQPSIGFGRIGSGTTPQSDSDEYYDGETPWVTTSELRESIILVTAKSVTAVALRDHSALSLFPVGALVIAMYGATIGRLGILGIPATVNQACCVFAEPTRLETKFVYHWLMAFRDVLVSHSAGGGQPNLSQQDLRALRIPAPAVPEQVLIGDFLDTATHQLDELTARAESAIERLQEYRTALITAAVTGKIDVRESATTSKGPAE